MTLVATSLFLESRITDTSGYLTLLPAFIVGGVGMGMTMSPMTAAVMSSVDRTKAGAASGVLSMTRMIGGVFGVASLTAIFEHLSKGRAAAGHAPADVFIYSLSHSLRYSAAVALVGALVAFAFIRTHRVDVVRGGSRRGHGDRRSGLIPYGPASSRPARVIARPRRRGCRRRTRLDWRLQSGQPKGEPHG